MTFVEVSKLTITPLHNKSLTRIVAHQRSPKAGHVASSSTSAVYPVPTSTQSEAVVYDFMAIGGEMQPAVNVERMPMRETHDGQHESTAKKSCVFGPAR
jgi:hypothetical protein